MTRKILVIDVGGTNVKLHVTGHGETIKFPSGKKLTPGRILRGALAAVAAKGWKFDAITVGIPAPIKRGKAVLEPANLGRGWTRFDWRKARKPLRLVNDAAMQALGSYKGGKLLFLGLGTGLGSALVVEGIVEPMELGHLPYRKATYEDYVGVRGLKRVGKKKWRRYVEDVVTRLVAALEPDDVVLGGGNVHKLRKLPPGCRAGENANAFRGGFLLWKAARDLGRPARGRSRRSVDR